MYEHLAQLFGLGGAGAAQGGPRTLGAMPNPAMAQQGAPQAGQPPAGMEGFMQRLQTPGMMGLLNAGTSMLGAAQQPGGLGQAMAAGAQGGLGGLAMAKQAQKEDERNAQFMEMMKAAGGVAGQGQRMAQQGGALGGMAPRQPAGINGAY